MFLASAIWIYMTRSFRPFLIEGKFRNCLDFEDMEDLGLYVHIPFCRSLCSFCPYFKVVYDQEQAAAFKSALLKEIELVCRELKEEKLVSSLYFGGGTPALMAEDLKEIIDALQSHFIIRGGIGVELHPSDLTQEVLEKLKTAGVTMVSLGIQSFDEGCLSKLGRNGDTFIEKMHLVREFGFSVVDVDLIFAIPGQTDEILKKDLMTAFDNGATQVSTYPFIDFTFADNEYKPMSRHVKKRMLEHLTGFAREKGIERTSVWTFAKKDTQKYSSVTRDAFLGFGPSATTLLKDIFKINTFSIEDYIDRVNIGFLPTSLTLDFTKRQRAAYYLFWGAYSMKFSREKFEGIIGTPLDRMFGVELYVAVKLGLLHRRGSWYELSDQAAILYHDIEQVYTTAYIDRMWNISRNEAFPRRIILK